MFLLTKNRISNRISVWNSSRTNYKLQVHINIAVKLPSWKKLEEKEGWFEVEDACPSVCFPCHWLAFSCPSLSISLTWVSILHLFFSPLFCYLLVYLPFAIWLLFLEINASFASFSRGRQREWDEKGLEENLLFFPKEFNF